VGTWVLKAHQKLPDDLTLAEFSDLVGAVESLCASSGARRASVLRVQYGSDFLLVVSIAGSAAAVLVSISVVVKNLAESRKSAAEARKLTSEAKAAEERATRAREAWQQHQNESKARADATAEMAGTVRRLQALALEFQVSARDARVAADAAERVIRRSDLDYEGRQAHPPNPDHFEIASLLAEKLKDSEPRLANRLKRRSIITPTNAIDSKIERLIEAVDQLASFDVELDVEDWG
jgi:mannitol-specific phosphotransferase system IIBC component